jgi:hypothetical protein
MTVQQCIDAIHKVFLTVTKKKNVTAVGNQLEQQKKVTFEEGFLALSKEAGVRYDPKYLLE